MGEDRVGEKGRAKLGDGLVAPEVMGKGTINPWQPYLVAPVGGLNNQPTEYNPPPHAQDGHKVVRRMQWC
jgi:hypothetical protein